MLRDCGNLGFDLRVIMFQNILVPVDETAFAEAAVPWALAMAGPRATLHIVHAHCFPPPATMVVYDQNLDQALLIQEEQYLDELADRVRAIVPQMAITTRNADVCSVQAETLAFAARKVCADLVVMATHGRGPLARFFFGSVSDMFSRLAPAPVLLVRPDERQTKVDLTIRPRLEQVVVPLDGSEFAEQVLKPAMSVAAAFGCRCTFVYVADQTADTSGERAEAYLDRIARSAPSDAITRREIIWNCSAAKAILAVAGSDPRTCIALATHGREGVDRFLNGSVADKVVRRAVGPVLVLHSAA
jgi:nucleotide-binding universal stress UspA family protein